jgi:hypothetical protein
MGSYKPHQEAPKYSFIHLFSFINSISGCKGTNKREQYKIDLKNYFYCQAEALGFAASIKAKAD